MSAKQNFTPAAKCTHCQNKAPMEIVASYTVSHALEEVSDDDVSQAWTTYELVRCPACDGILLRSYFYGDWMDPEDIQPGFLYPALEKAIKGLPRKIEDAHNSAKRVKADPNAYGVLLGRVLDMVCADRNAEGETLHARLQYLAGKGEIPVNLVEVASGLRKLRNVGAHADLGELTEAETPVLSDLTRAILEYVYAAPKLALEAQESLLRLQAAKKKVNPARK